MRIGYVVIDGGAPRRARVRNALWAISGKAIGSSVLKKDYPQVSDDETSLRTYDAPHCKQTRLIPHAPQ